MVTRSITDYREVRGKLHYQRLYQDRRDRVFLRKATVLINKGISDARGKKDIAGSSHYTGRVSRIRYP